MIELTTVANLALLYLLYCLINRFVRDRSIFSDLNKIGGSFGKLNEKHLKDLENRKNNDNLSVKEDIPVLRQNMVPKTPDIKLDVIKPDIKIETSFDNMRIGEYKK